MGCLSWGYFFQKTDRVMTTPHCMCVSLRAKLLSVMYIYIYIYMLTRQTSDCHRAWHFSCYLLSVDLFVGKCCRMIENCPNMICDRYFVIKLIVHITVRNMLVGWNNESGRGCDKQISRFLVYMEPNLWKTLSNAHLIIILSLMLLYVL